MTNRVSTKIIDVNDIEKEKQSINKPIAVDIGDNCFVTSEVLAEQFCDGFEGGLEIMKQLSGLDPNDFDYKCTLNPFIDYDNPDNKKLEQLNDPNIRNVLLEQYIDITQESDMVDPYTNKKVKVNNLIQRLLAKRDLGTKEEVYCITPPKLLADKFCKGFTQSIDTFLGHSKLDKTKFAKNCVSEENPTDKNKRKIIFGVQRKD